LENHASDFIGAIVCNGLGHGSVAMVLCTNLAKKIKRLDVDEEIPQEFPKQWTMCIVANFCETQS